MDFLIGPTVAYFLTIIAVMTLLMTAMLPRSFPLKVVMVLSLVAAGLEYSRLPANPWALLLVALSPLPFFIAIRPPRFRPVLALVTIALLTIGSVFIFLDSEGRLYSVPVAGLVSYICGRVIWIMFLRIREKRSPRFMHDPDSVIGLVGVARTEIEKFGTGMVELDGEYWVARSDEPITRGSAVRILRFDGMALTVEKMEKLTKE